MPSQEQKIDEQLRLLIDSVKDYAIFMLDPRGYIATWNAGAERIKGYKAAEIIGRHFSIFYPREDIDAGKCEHELRVAASEGRFEDEGWRLRKDGTPFWANVIITALRDASGTLVGFGKVTRDLTLRVQAERERILRARAEESERRREDFLAIMGHELRNPLAPMVTALHMIKLRRGLKCDREIAVLERQVASMTRLLDDLLDLSRTLRSTASTSRHPFEIGEVLSDAVDVAGPLLRQKEHVLSVEVPESPLPVDVDRDRMTQVFVNLLNNAAKYSDPGGRIRVRAAALGDDGVQVTVEDDGIGIAADVLPRVFELFTQGPSNVERQLGGLGIGLAVAQRLVREHGGEITAESAGVGEGSRFTVRLPRAVPAETSGAPARAPSAPARRAAPRRVLVVDDNEDSSEMMRAFLEELGHEVYVALDGPRGLDLAREVEPDIAFLDLGLPGMNGFELARHIREIPVCAEIPLVAVSGYARESDRTAAAQAGFSAHFAKPFDPSTLESIVERAQRCA